jgi:hypothetical protein
MWKRASTTSVQPHGTVEGMLLNGGLFSTLSPFMP